jgi:hypothetical protein
MMHFFVKSVETPSLSHFDVAAMLQHRLLALDHLSALYADKKLGFFFRSPDGSISYELHRSDDLLELDARLKANPQWPYCSHEVIPVTKTGDMVRELTAYLGIDANAFFEDALSRYQNRGILTASHTDEIRKRAVGGFVELMSADEEPIDENGVYTVVAKASKGTSASVPVEQLQEMWMRALRAQVAHLNSDVEFIDYNPVGRSEGLLIGKGDIDVLKKHIESTEIYPDTVVSYFPVHTSSVAARAAATQLMALQRSLPALKIVSQFI